MTMSGSQSNSPQPDKRSAGEFSNDLDWMAFCYIADELSGEELAQFEARLASDQAARDAVEQAMRISTAIYECKLPTSEPAVRTVQAAAHSADSSRSASSSRTVAQWIVGLAAALLVGVGLAAWMANSNQSKSGDIAMTQDEELAIAWADTLQEVELSVVVDEFQDEFQFASLEGSGDEDDWMFVAFTQMELDTGEDLTQ